MRVFEHPDLADVPLAGILSALGDPVRLKILRVLLDGQEHLGPDFAVGIGQSTLSHHMRILRQAGIAQSVPRGTRCFVSLRREEVDAQFPGLLNAVARASVA
ncbi:metalloregulator ArsR/SmtB family transcription factor [Glaciihabitans sp. UYNi722]|uniref:ArsR/SmtB family transcription factor n=1 Tax=Glaciihabitans sp. UYNi722 TaxID=3156344 RepID=UPI003390B4AF